MRWTARPNTKPALARWPQQLVSSVPYPYPRCGNGPLAMVIKDKETERWLDIRLEEGLLLDSCWQRKAERIAEAILTRFESTRDSEEEKELAAYIRERLSTATQ